MSILNETCPLNNGLTIPKLGFGTWEIPDDQAEVSVKKALETGYRLIDTAQAYGNEAGVGRGIKASGIPRDEIFVTTKLAAEIKDYEEAKKAIDESLERLGMDYIDLLIIHSPKPWDKFYEDEHYFEGNLEAWKAMEEAYHAGKLKVIGVSNFEQVDLDNILNHASVKPAVNQILAHIGQTPLDLIQYTQDKDILVEAYSPIAHGVMLNQPMIKDMAERYGVSIAQLAIRYDLELGLLPLPKTENPAHMANNANVDFTITEDDMETLKAIDHFTYEEFEQFPVFGKTKR
ncbi:MAG: aldo/keto reductase [Aerococcus sp.]|nr:aldo/keto reductase [Aerococcus sp.]